MVKLLNKKPLIKNIIIAITALGLITLGIDLFIRNVVSRKADFGDAPLSYGKAIHYQPDKGPYFGQNRGDDDSGTFNDSTYFATLDNTNGINDEDAFVQNSGDTNLKMSKTPVFVSEIHVDDQIFSLNIPIKNAEIGDPVRGWIDFNGNQIFDKEEKASTEYKAGNSVTLTWQIPAKIHTSLSYLRLRTCNKVFKEDVEFSNGKVNTGEVEDFVVRIIKSIIPSTEVKANLDLTKLDGLSGLDLIPNTLNKLKIGNKNFSINLGGTSPSFIGINNLDESSMVGLRIGHEKNVVSSKNPILIKLTSDTALENLRFKIIDINNGDRVKIEGFYKGIPAQFTINNLTDNFYHQFNSITNEVFGFSKSETIIANSFIKSSLDVGINVSFVNMVDSVQLSYSDDLKLNNGSITIGDISTRKYNLPPISISNFKIEEVDEDVDLFWKIEKNSNVGAYSVERSYDAKSYEIIGNSVINNSQMNTYTYIDKTILPIIQDCYYKIKVVEKDNHVSYSPVLRLKRKNSIGLTGIKPTGSFFTSSVELLLVVDMPGEIKVNMYDNQGNKVFSKVFKDIKANDLISLDGLAKLPPNSYYIEASNNGKRYLVQVEKNERTSRGTIIL